MKKRLTCMLLAAVILISLLSIGAAATPVLTTSDEAIRILKAEEGFSAKPYWDYSQWTIGYGTKCPDGKLETYRANGVTKEEAEQLLRDHLARFESELYKFINKTGVELDQKQFDALVLFSYNCGSSWTYDTTSRIYNAVTSAATGSELIDAFSRWCYAGGQIKTFLLRRRLCEANMYLNGVYSQAAPDHFGYVFYDARGGVATPNVQGYDTQLTAQIIPVPTYAGRTFEGWYTAKTGGTKVTVLDASVKNTRLYARWSGGDAAGDTTSKGVEVTVTADEVNIRKGPGTEHAIAGSAIMGDQLLITETAQGGGYTWGKFDQGWICLKYTDYDTASAPETPAEPEQPTAPEKPTEPEKPAEPEKPSKRTGTVKANGGLRIRSGPSTGYGVVGSLPSGTKVEILEQKIAGAMVWGKISKGWISLDYVVLDPEADTEEKPVEKPAEKPTQTPETQPPETQPSEKEPELAKGWTGKVNVKDALRIRLEPTTASKIVGYLYPNEKVTITQEKSSASMTWGKISKGWISLDYVVADTAGTQSGTEKTTGTVEVDDYLRIRSGPGVSYAIAGYLSNGTKVDITEKKTVGSTVWGKISKGWISLDYVSFGEKNSANNTSTPAEITVGTVKVDDFLRIRSGPGTTNDTVGHLSNGTKVEITEKKTVGSTVWGKISKGWISLDYVVIGQQSSTSAAQKVTKTVTADCLRVRSGAGLKNTVSDYLYQGAKVDILETKTVDGTVWGRISKGWISMDYVK